MDILQACRAGDLVCVKKHLDRGESVEQTDCYEWTGLMLASWYGHENVVTFLLDRGANINAQSITGTTALMLASEYGWRIIVELLVNRGANIKARNCEKQTALTYAFQLQEMSIARYLASLMILNPDVLYSDVSTSLFIPRHKQVPAPDYTELVKILVPTYIERAVTDSEFGISMQQDIEEIFSGKTEKNRKSLTKKDISLLTKLLKTLRSIDYTDRVGQESDEKASPAYDMEL